LVIEQNLYAINDKGILTCLRTDTGKTIFQHRIRGNFSASPIYAGGHLYFCDQSGETTVLKHGNQYQQVAKNQLDGKLMASPAVADGSIFLRTDQAIYRIGQE
jgi:outer membrane protein assembly factor BamB